MARHLLADGAARINIFSRDEAKQDQMRRSFNDERVRFFLGDVRDIDSVRTAVLDADFVFHAAALKQVPSCEFFPQQAVKTNVNGSHNVIEASSAAGVRSVVLPEHRQGRLPGQRDGHVEGADGEDRAGLRPQPPRLRHDGVGHALRQRHVLPRLGHPCLHLPPQGGQAAHHHRPANDPLPHVARRLRRPRQARVRARAAGRPVRPQGGRRRPWRPSPPPSVGLFGQDEPEIHRIGTRHGEKLHETLLTREEIAKAADQGDYFRVPLDDRGLQYEKYFSEGEEEIDTTIDYSSDSVPLLDVDADRGAAAHHPRGRRRPGAARVKLAPDRGRGLPRLAPALPTARDHRPRGRRQSAATDWQRLPELVADVDAVIHVAGVNRASDDELVDGNVALRASRRRRARADERRRRSSSPTPSRSATDRRTPQGKEQAAAVLRAAAEQAGGRFVDVHLPNLFGEHGRPGYNSFVATFVDRVVSGDAPEIADRPIELLHAQGAAQALLDALDPTLARHGPTRGAPDLGAGGLGRRSSGSTRRTSRARTSRRWPTTSSATCSTPTARPSSRRTTRSRSRPRTDQRGRLVETVRTHGSGGQTFVSTTVPGVTRGDPLPPAQDRAVRRARRRGGRSGCVGCSTTTSSSFPVSGDRPAVIDMPTMWSHDITNVGDGVLTTLFWTDSLFDPEAPDTIHEPVVRPAREETA